MSEENAIEKADDEAGTELATTADVGKALAEMLGGGHLEGAPIRLDEIGRLRTGDRVPVFDRKTGEQRTNKRGEPMFRPRALSEFRMTSASKGVITAIAQTLEKEVQEWPHPTLDEDQWQVYTGLPSIVAVLPPSDVGMGSYLMRAWEHWQFGYCERRCDGRHAEVVVTNDAEDRDEWRIERGVPCMCGEQKGTGDAFCKPTTRVSFILPSVPGMGVWRLETHGIIAAQTLAGTCAFARQWAPPGSAIPGEIRIISSGGRDRLGRKRNYIVPKFIPAMSPRDLSAGNFEGAAMFAPSSVRNRAALAAPGGQVRELESGDFDEEPSEDPPESPPEEVESGSFEADPMDEDPGAETLEGEAIDPEDEAPAEVDVGEDPGDPGERVQALWEYGASLNLNVDEVKSVIRGAGLPRPGPRALADTEEGAARFARMVEALTAHAEGA